MLLCGVYRPWPLEGRCLGTMGSSSKKLEELDFGLSDFPDDGIAETLRLCIFRAGAVGGAGPALAMDGTNGDCRGLSDRLLLRGGGATVVGV